MAAGTHRPGTYTATRRSCCSLEIPAWSAARRPANIYAQRFLVPRRRIESERAVAHPKTLSATHSLPECCRYIAALTAGAVIRAHDFVLLRHTMYRRSAHHQQQSSRQCQCSSQILSELHGSPCRFFERLRDSNVARKSALHYVHGSPLRRNSYGARQENAHASSQMSPAF